MIHSEAFSGIRAISHGSGSRHGLPSEVWAMRRSTTACATGCQSSALFGGRRFHHLLRRLRAVRCLIGPAGSAARRCRFMPTGESPLKYHEGFCTPVPKVRRTRERETDTMDTFVCSSWYQYAY